MTLKDFGSIRGVVFLLMACAAVVALFVGKIDPKDFTGLVSMAFVAYFSRGRDSQTPVV